MQTSAGPSVTVTDRAAANLSATVTIPEYQAFRATSAASAPRASPSDALQQAAADENRRAAVANLRAELQARESNSRVNVAVVPPLTHAALRTAAAAAEGDTRAEFAAAFDLTPTRFVREQQTGRVATSLWGEQNHRFASAFLLGVDALRGTAQAPVWSAGEASFASGATASDPALAASLKAASPELKLGSFRDPRNIRLLVTHSMAAQVAWSDATRFEGIFERKPQDLWLLPMLRLRAGVSRLEGADFTADWVGSGETRLLMLRPRTGALTPFAAARLDDALGETIRAMQMSGASPTPGEIVLPTGEIALRQQSDAPLRRAGVTRVFHEALADLRRLDYFGGVYLDPVSPSARLGIGADGVALQAAQALAFTWSPLNLYFGAPPPFGGDFTNLPPRVGTCTWPKPDLRSFFLALVDPQGWLISLAAIDTLPGAIVEPACSGVVLRSP